MGCILLFVTKSCTASHIHWTQDPHTDPNATDARHPVVSARLLLLGRSRVRLCIRPRGCGAPTMGPGRHAWGTVPVPLRCVWGTDSGPSQCAWGAGSGPCSVSGGPTEAPTDSWQRGELGGWIQGAGFGSLGVKGLFACQRPRGPRDL